MTAALIPGDLGQVRRLEQGSADRPGGPPPARSISVSFYAGGLKDAASDPLTSVSPKLGL